MILVAGGTGRLGRALVGLLTERGRPVRVLTRDPARAAGLGPGVEVVEGDVGDRAAIERAVAGVETVVSAIQGFAGQGQVSPARVDRAGNRQLIQAAQTAGVEHFVLVSIQGVRPNHPMELFRCKYQAEQALCGSALAWTILRPTASMETWLELIGDPLVRTGQTRLFGRGTNPINFVSVQDVAHLAAAAVADRSFLGQILEWGGPQNLTFEQFVETVAAVTGVRAQRRHVPRAALRALAVLLRPVQPTLARQAQAAVVMDTADFRFDAMPTRSRVPNLPLTSLAEVVRRTYPRPA